MPATKKAAKKGTKTTIKSSKPKQETIIVCSAHSDDFVIGAGGMIKNLTDEGKKVISIVFSFGEKSHPWMKEEIVAKFRRHEALDASKILGCQTYVYDLKEFAFLSEYKEKGIDKIMMGFIEKFKPTKIFTHSNEDPHPDHRAVHQITREVFDKIKRTKPELYIFSVWNPVSFKTNYPSLYVDITNSFSAKLKALATFRSQKIHVVYPTALLFFRAIKEGLKIKKRFAEHFYRLK